MIAGHIDLPVHGPVCHGQPPTQERYKIIGHTDDEKPAITSMSVFCVVDRVMELLRMHQGAGFIGILLPRSVSSCLYLS